MKKYSPKEIEPKWQKVWEDTKIYEVSDELEAEKKYIMEYFPYPSGSAMHVGHVRNYVIGDAMARYERMQGKSVLHPMGWDSFGLPAENYAIKTGISPRQAIDENTAKFKQQLTQMGFGYDWSREIDSSDPDYYRWTQWFFLMLHRRGLAYRKESLQWWCPFDKTVLANEQVEDGLCWRCDNEVVKKPLKQWFFKITDYADRLVDDLDTVDWSDALKRMQRNWIGRKTGIEITYPVDGLNETITCFTTRPDTNFGATFLVIAPEHSFAKKVAAGEITPEAGDNSKEVEAYIQQTLSKSEIDRQLEGRKKTGVFTGFYVHNKLNGRKLPVWVSDFVLAGFGTGAVIGVPGHDSRDFEFAQEYDLPIERVVIGPDGDESPITEPEQVNEEAGVMVNSDFLNGVEINDAIEKMMDHMEEKDMGSRVVNYRIRDWLISRQRYWGAPIPMVHCANCYKPTTDSAAEIDFAHHAGFVAARTGEKTVLTRAKTQELSSLSVGDLLTLTDAKTGEQIYVNAKAINEYIGVDDLYKNSDYANQTFMKEFSSIEELRAEYNGNRPGYDKELDEVGIVVIEFDVATKEVAVPEKDLPVILPEMDNYEPSGDGKSPLAKAEEWVNTDCPECDGPARRETDTMDGFACSSWYFLRFADPHNSEAPFDAEKAKTWLPVDSYIGGAEHAVMHLLYARFWTKVMHDDGLIDFDEPFAALRNHGMILGPDHNKMSKSKGNVIAPDELIEQGYGADSIRLMELFIGPWNQEAAWSVNGVTGTYRFLQRIWTHVQEVIEAKDAGKKADPEKVVMLSIATQKTIKKVTEDLENLRFNTAVAAIMELINTLNKLKTELPMDEAYEEWRTNTAHLLQILAPFAPHMAEELWSQMGFDESVHISDWPTWDDDMIVDDIMTIVVQVNGKVRANIDVARGTDEEEVKTIAREDENVLRHTEGKNIVKEIYVQDKLVSIVVK